ncbi:membrane protein [Streptococcus agalactiae ILRI112]|nr:hypothetical protein B7934_01360 [Streptococcus agalactiae]CCW39180.1 membrane protein [Streptococcus agalactiae ILRI005]CCW41336.1 membrane protein [Streptococcus agalactiae ILRI112]OTG54421.1 hypothetical protein B7931_01140 [Streptococcus agalactiae]RRA73042.1 hypothetical protein D5F89_03580 [Streptococcus agalactiae]
MSFKIDYNTQSFVYFYSIHPRINHLEKRLEDYKDNEAMYKSQGSNAFTKNFRKTLTRDNKLRANLKRKERLTEELKRLRGEL